MGVSISFSLISQNEINSVAYTITEYNERLFAKIEKLEGYAREFKAANPSVKTSVTELSLQFIRKNDYASGGWEILLGSIDKNFVSYVEGMDSGFKFSSNDILYDPHTGKKIDFIHMIAALNCYYKHGDTFSYLFVSVGTHFAGWAGDLLTLLAEEVAYRMDHSIVDTAVLSDYVNKLLGTNESSSFDYQDSLANFDAININQLSLLQNNLSSAMRSYYKDTTSAGNNAYNRMNSVRSKFVSKEELKTTALSYLNNSLIANVILDDPYKTNYNNSNSSDKELVANEFAEYVYGKVYANTSINNINLMVNETITFNIKEKNVFESNALNYDSSVISVNISNFVVSVKALKYGNTNIIVKNGAENVMSVPVNVRNVNPIIDIQPKSKVHNYVGKIENISFTAKGSFNKYRWYIYDTKTIDSNRIFLTETEVPTINLLLKEDYNNKFLRCEVSNEGNSAVYTLPIELVVTLEDNKKKQDDSSSKETPKVDDIFSDSLTDYNENDSSLKDGILSDNSKVDIQTDTNISDKITGNVDIPNSGSTNNIEEGFTDADSNFNGDSSVVDKKQNQKEIVYVTDNNSFLFFVITILVVLVTIVIIYFKKLKKRAD